MSTVMEHTLKITDEEREMAYELRWMVEGILLERERMVLYREIYAAAHQRAGCRHDTAAMEAKTAIQHMERAFMPAYDTNEDNERASQQKAN